VVRAAPRLSFLVAKPAGATAAGTREQKRPERLRLDGIFVGDHLKPAGPYPESMVGLAVAPSPSASTSASA
jgi:hypothetical protein